MKINTWQQWSAASCILGRYHVTQSRGQRTSGRTCMCVYVIMCACALFDTIMGYVNVVMCVGAPLNSIWATSFRQRLCASVHMSSCTRKCVPCVRKIQGMCAYACMYVKPRSIYLCPHLSNTILGAGISGDAHMRTCLVFYVRYLCLHLSNTLLLGAGVSGEAHMRTCRTQYVCM